MTRHLRLTPVLLVAAFLAGCQGPCEKLDPITAPVASRGSADFARFAAAGTSISAGYQSGGIVNRHQVYAYPALFARQVGMTIQLDGRGTFSQPAVDGNGLLPLLQLRSISPLVISNSGLAPGTAINSTQAAAYGDMAVPGSIAYDFANTTNYANGLFPVVTRGLGSIQNQLLSLNPTFVSFEFGANEVLGRATAGSAIFGSAATRAATNPAAYAAFVGGAVAAIHAAVPNARMAMANVPDVRSIPFFTTFPPLTRDVRTGGFRALMGWVHRDSLTGVDGSGNPIYATIIKLDSLAATELITLTAQTSLATGRGFQPFTYNYLINAVNGTGAPLDSFYVLDAKEQAVLAADIAAMNATVASQAAASWIALVDLHGLLADLAAHGRTIGSTRYTTEFVRGGLFSLDGVHPSDLGHALLTNAMIDAVNAKFGCTIAHLNPPEYATGTSSAARPVTPEGGGLAGVRIDGLEESLRRLYGR